MSTIYKQIYHVISKIPRGRVATYGQIARLIGKPRHARQVGYALAALSDGSHNVPWHRVVNAQGKISRRVAAGSDEFQKILLEEEGVEFKDNDTIDLARYQWRRR